ncbi:MAG: ornithine cyclodeaminase family protein [Thaumarchaeota archaeon]|nr:ornithine cyclodeaminase family protein [Nitrososphaerota archaeon]
MASSSSEVLFLSSEDAQSIVGMDEATDLVEKSFLLHHNGKTVLAPRSRQLVPKHHGAALLQASFVDDVDDILIAKVSMDYPDNPLLFKIPSVAGFILYLDPRTGVPIGVLDSTYISAVRTGGNGALGVKYLSREDSETVAVIGSGVQARAGLTATLKARPRIRRAFVYSPTKQHRDDFAKTMGESLGLEVSPCSSSEEAVRKADIVYLATYAQKPPVLRKHLNAGTHVSAVGYQAEIDLGFFDGSKVVVSDLKSVVETGALADAMRKGLVDEKSIYASMGEIVAGEKKGRTTQNEVTLYIATGMTVQDAVVAKVVYDEAKARNIGKKFTYTSLGAFKE